MRFSGGRLECAKSEKAMNWDLVVNIILPVAAVLVLLTRLGRQIFVEAIKHPLRTTEIRPDGGKTQVAKSHG